MRVTEKALKEYGNEVKNWTLIPSKGGTFELTVNGKLLYSKLETGRHMEEQEIIVLLKEVLDSL